jgi:hypothetical protein
MEKPIGWYRTADLGNVGKGNGRLSVGYKVAEGGKIRRRATISDLADENNEIEFLEGEVAWTIRFFCGENAPQWFIELTRSLVELLEGPKYGLRCSDGADDKRRRQYAVQRIEDVFKHVSRSVWDLRTQESIRATEAAFAQDYLYEHSGMLGLHRHLRWPRR